MTVLEFNNLSKVFFRSHVPVHALQEVSLGVRPGELLAIVGPSGCGKSTLLNLASGLMPSGAGEVRYRGELVRGVVTHMSYVTQKDNLLPWRTAHANVQLALEFASGRKLSRQQRAERVQHYLDLVGLSGFEKHYPAELSGGMRKRVSLARALVSEPDVLLMDEPFGALDAQLKLVLSAELLRVWEATGRTLVFVTHDLGEAIAIADRVVVMSARPGRIREICDIDLPRPRDVFSVRFDEKFEGYHQRLWDALRPAVVQDRSAS